MSLHQLARKATTAALAAALAFAGVLTYSPTAAAVEEAPVVLPETVSADALPTWQINGVVWSQAIVGNTAYVVGKFTAARPPGVPAGGAGEVRARNIFAFDIRTGNPVPFPYELEAQGLIVRADADGKRLYVGGDFTKVFTPTDPDGVARGHVAAFDIDAAGNATLSGDFKPNVGGQVRGFAITKNKVYVGGNFYGAGGQARSLFAAFSPSNGAIDMDWAPSGDGGYVWTMVMSPDNSRVLAGGSFTTINGQSAYGMGAIDPTTGAVLPFAANSVIRTAGNNGAIASLHVDGTQVYGTGYAFGAGASFEGSFAADPNTGSIKWIQDCLGDTYDAFPMNGVVYSVSHAHDCTVVGGFPDTSPRSRWTKALASPTFGVDTIDIKDAYGWDFRGYQYPGLLGWFPDLKFGTFTEQGQAAWSAIGNGDYLLLGGEFPTVNGQAQQGLVRFAKRSIAPRAVGPVYNANMTPTLISPESGVMKVLFQAAWDRDNTKLYYDVFRNSGPKIATVERTSSFWNLPVMAFTDRGLTPGSQVRYQIRARDGDGNVQWSAWTGWTTVSDTPPSVYGAAVAARGASSHWRFDDEPGSTTILDSIGDLQGAGTNVTLGVNGAISSGGSAISMTSATSQVTTSTLVEHAPEEFTIATWVRTNNTRGGRILGYGDNATINSVNYDRVLYLDNSGRPNLTILDNGVYRTLTSPVSVNNNQWRHVVATLGADGMQIFVDGVRVARDQRWTSADHYGGYWRIGADLTTGFTNRPTNQALIGTLDELALYPRVLTQAEIRDDYLASGRSANWPATPTDAYGAAVAADSPDLYWRFDATSGAADTSGNGQDGSRSLFGLSSSTDTAIPSGRSLKFDGSSGRVISQRLWTGGPASFSSEAWFKTNTNRGGLIVGFGNSASGFSSSYDRHVYMTNSGQLSFGTFDGVENTLLSPSSYNDNQWHHVVATQGPEGMRLWVDSKLVGTNAVTNGEIYNGYWRVGAENLWGNATSRYFAGTIDEVAVYARALSEDTIRAHYVASGRTAANRAPVASFTESLNRLALSVDGSASTDADGPIASYAWNFGDGTTATGATASHTYAAAGTYTVSLTVTDPQGLSNTATKQVTAVTNVVPVAAFTPSVEHLAVSVDGSASSDADGTIASYAWDFGDGATATGATASHTYAAAGTFTVTLTVTDNQGATGSVTHEVTVAPSPNDAPVAAFTSSVAGLGVAVDGSGSSDQDGSIASYEWNFGDGTTATGATASHTYAAAGTYTVTLTVTDNQGATGSVSHSVTVAVPVTPPIAKDTFERTLATGWGTADVGGAWALGNNTSRFAVTGGVGTVLVPNGGYTATLSGVDNVDNSVRVAVSIDREATGGGQYLSVIGRQTATGSYRAKLKIGADGAVTAYLTRVAGSEATLSWGVIPGLTYTAGEKLNIRLDVTGSGTSTLGVKVWKASGVEPADWTRTATDSTSGLQTAGTIGVYSYVSGSATNGPTLFSYDDLVVATAG